MAMLNLIHT